LKRLNRKSFFLSCSQNTKTSILFIISIFLIYNHNFRYLQRVAENPQVDRVVGGVRNASIGAGSMATTIAATVTETTKSNIAATKGKMDSLRGYTPEYFAKQATEEEAWRQVLMEGNGGEELNVPARQEFTSSFYVKAGSLLTWKFRVQNLDIGFAIRLRVQGDGGATEVDVFAMQKYESGVTVQGEWSPTTDSSLVIVWDNTYSYLRSKVVAFQAVVKTQSEHEADLLKAKQKEEERKQKEQKEAEEEVPPPPPPKNSESESTESTNQESESVEPVKEVVVVKEAETEKKDIESEPVQENTPTKEETTQETTVVTDDKEKDADY